MKTEHSNRQKSPLSPTARAIISVAIVMYLLVVLLGPMSNPISSANFTEPLSRIVSPIHESLFLGHGYRFFGPDPGPSHIVEYKIKLSDDSISEGRFPDREKHWPRLRYHRWFMLSETIYEESINLVDENQHQQMLRDMNAEIENLRLNGELPSMQQLVVQRDRLEENYQYSRNRLDEMLQQLANFLLADYEGKSIELFLRERLIARPVDIQSRVRLTDPRFLSDPISLGEFTATSNQDVEVIE